MVSQIQINQANSSSYDDIYDTYIMILEELIITSHVQLQSLVMFS